jgi:hypothetical protein
MLALISRKWAMFCKIRPSVMTWLVAVSVGVSLATAQAPPPPLLDAPTLAAPSPETGPEGSRRNAAEQTPQLTAPANHAPATSPSVLSNKKAAAKQGSLLEFTDAEAIESMDGLLIDIARKAIPMHYENTKDWGKTKERWDGLHIVRDGFQIKTKRRKKAVNHGTWKKYEIKNLSPDEFKLDIVHVRQHEDGVKFEVDAEAHLGISGRLSQWQLGVQLISLSVDAEARVKLHMECFMRMQFDPSKLPPDVVLDPRVDDAKLEIVEFRVKDVSRLGGTLSKQLGKGVREVLEDRIVDEPQKLVAKINRQIDKQRDDLRFSLYDMIQSKLKSKPEQPNVSSNPNTKNANRN